MTKQEIFDKVVNHLLTQNKQCSVEDASYANGLKCLYRGPNGLKCAIGCLIPDELYCPEMEGLRAMNVITSYDIEELTGYEYFANALQEIHDNYEPRFWSQKLKEVAKDHCLEFNYVQPETVAV